MFRNSYNRIVKYCLLAVILMTSSKIATQNWSESKVGELTSILEAEFSDEFEFSVLVEQDNERVYFEIFGKTDEKGSTSLNEKTLFNIASITKSITAVGIFKLIEQNKLNLDDNLNKFFEGVPESKKSITIEHLLSHKSGLRQTYPLEGVTDDDEALKIILDQKLEFSPGSGFRYSNQNYQLLALIMAQVTATRYVDHIRNSVLIPLEMQDTYFWDEAGQQTNLAELDDEIKRLMSKRNWDYIGSAGVFSTAEDLSNFWNGIYKNEFIANETIQLIFKPYYKTGSGIEIGLGFFKSPNTKWKTPELWSRGSESWGHNAVIRHFPEKNVTIIVTTNSGEIDNDSSKTGNKLVSDRVSDYVFD